MFPPARSCFAVDKDLELAGERRRVVFEIAARNCHARNGQMIDLNLTVRGSIEMSGLRSPTGNKPRLNPCPCLKADGSRVTTADF